MWIGLDRPIGIELSLEMAAGGALQGPPRLLKSEKGLIFRVFKFDLPMITRAFIAIWRSYFRVRSPFECVTKPNVDHLFRDDSWKKGGGELGWVAGWTETASAAALRWVARIPRLAKLIVDYFWRSFVIEGIHGIPRIKTTVAHWNRLNSRRQIQNHRSIKQSINTQLDESAVGGPEGVTRSYRTQNAQHNNRHFCELFDLSS